MADHKAEALENIAAVHSIKDPTELVRFYDEKWAKNYERDMESVRKGGPEKFANFVAQSLSNENKDLSIIDIGAGTGWVGLHLGNAGFNNLYAHDGSKQMLKIAAEKNVYKKFYEEILLENTASKTMAKNSFDVMVSLATFSRYGTGLTEKHLEALIDLIKPGGILFLGINSMAFTEELKDKLSELSTRGRVNKIQHQVIEGWSEHRDLSSGQVHQYQGVFLGFEILD